MTRLQAYRSHTIAEFISGFSGSAGTAVISSDKAALATDGRYFNQASKQLDNNWTLLKQGLTDVPTWQEWCGCHISSPFLWAKLDQGGGAGQRWEGGWSRSYCHNSARRPEALENSQ